jgi:excisionase family DNA binding protein
MNHRTPSPVASRPDQGSRSACPGCDGLSCASARRSSLTNELTDPGQSSARSALRPLLTIEQVAEILAVSPKTVRRLIARGFPRIAFGRVLRFDPADVQRWVQARRS